MKTHPWKGRGQVTWLFNFFDPAPIISLEQLEFGVQVGYIIPPLKGTWSESHNNNNNNIHICIAPYGRNFRGAGNEMKWPISILEAYVCTWIGKRTWLVTSTVFSKMKDLYMTQAAMYSVISVNINVYYLENGPRWSHCYFRPLTGSDIWPIEYRQFWRL